MGEPEPTADEHETVPPPPGAGADLDETRSELPPEFAETLLESTVNSSSSGVRNRQQIGDFHIESELARGGMGVVYVARSPKLDRRVALKVLIAGDLADAEALGRFRREAQAAARLRHPGVVAVHEVGEDDGLPFIVMDLIEGESLKARLVREGHLPQREAAAIAETLARALDHAHEHKILHRDMKPANVLLNKNGEPVITDFGLAKVVEADAEGQTRTGQIMGTPAYMPPEQAEGQAGGVDARADVYALGATLYHMLTGEPPFRGESAMKVIRDVILREPAPPSALRPKLDRDLETICLRCLEKEPGLRYATARALGDDLGRYLRHEPVEARRPGPLERAGKWARRNRPVVRVLVIAVATLAVLGAGARAWVADTRATARAEEAQRVRRAEAETQRREAEILHWLSLAEEGALAHREARRAAVVEILRNAVPGTTRLLVDRLEAISTKLGEAGDAALLAAEFPTEDEARVGAKPIPGLRAALALRQRISGSDALPAEANEALHEASHRLLQREGRALARSTHANRTPITMRHILARHQLAALGAGGFDVAELICATLGRTESTQAIVDGLSNYLAVVEDEERALAAGVALAAHGTPHAFEVIVAACRRFGFNGPFGTGLRDALAELSAEDKVHDVLRAPTPKGYLRRARARQLLGDLAGAYADTNLGLALDPNDPVLLNVRGAIRAAQGDREGARTDLDAAIAAKADLVSAWFDRGRLRRAMGDLEGARADYDHVLDLSPIDAGALTNRAGVRLAQGDLDGAFEDIELGIKHGPSLAVAWDVRGRILREQGHPADALAAFKRATELDPRSVGAWINLARTHYEQQRMVETLAAAKRALAIDPASPHALSLQAYAKAELGDLAGAIADLDAAIALSPNEAEFFSKRGGLRELAGNPEGASEDLDRAVAIAPKDSEVWQFRAQLRKRRGDLEGALADGDKAIELNPKSSSAWSERGLVLGELGQFERALADHREAIRLAPNSAVAWNNLGTGLQGSGKLPEAIEAYTRALALDPGIALAWSNRGSAFEAQGELERAKADYDRALGIDPSFAGTWFNRGNVRRALGDAAGARADFTHALELDPEDVDALSNRANTYLREGALERALADYDRAIELAPDRAQLHANRAHVRLTNRDAAGAIEDFLSATRLEPKNPKHWFGLGNVHGRAGDLDAARGAFTRALDLQPGHVEARLSRGLTYEFQGDREHALADYDRAVEDAPKNGKARAYRASTRAKHGDVRGAIADYGALLEIDPEYADSLRLRGELLARAGDVTAAIADLERFLERAPRDPAASEAKALLETLRGRAKAKPSD